MNLRLLPFVAALVASVACTAQTASSSSASTERLSVPAAAPTATAPRVVTLSAVGDTILGNTPSLPAHPGHYYDPVHKVLTAAQIVFGNLEGTLTTASHSKCSPSSSDCFAFRNPPSYAKSVFAHAGYTVLNNANNHSHDFGQTGVEQTLQALKGADIKHEGLPGQIAYIRTSGVRVAIVGFAPYQETANMLDLNGAARLVHKAAAHASVVIVYMHAGAEGSDRQHVTGREEYYVGEDRGNPKAFAHRVIRAGADLVIASGPHVLRGMEFYRGRLIAYSLGNFANYRNFGRGGDLSESAILHVSLGPHGGFRTARIYSVNLVDPGRAVLGGDSINTIRQLSKDDFGSHAPRIGGKGVIRPPA